LRGTTAAWTRWSANSRNAVERELPERGLDRLPYGLRRVPPPVVPLGNAVAEMRVLERRRRDAGQLDPSHQLVSGGETDPEIDEILRLAEARDPALLRLEREERLRPCRLPPVEKSPIALQQLEQRAGLPDIELT
jgi:hypothetical protein